MNLYVPMYSMRSYASGEYTLLKDGNLKVVLSRMSANDLLVIPDRVSDLDEFLSLGLVSESKLIKAKYDVNAVESRRNFWTANGYFDHINAEMVVTDITGYRGNKPFMNNFPITKLPDYPREYIDEFFESDLDSIRRAVHTTCLNQVQIDYITKVDPSLNGKITVNRKVVSKKYFDTVGLEIPELPHFDIFFPFRLTDKAYKFDEVVLENPDKIILVTDPNESYDGRYRNVIVRKLSKREYYGVLSTKPLIIYKENPEIVFHAGLADFLYFGCPIISEHKIPTLEEVLA